MRTVSTINGCLLAGDFKATLHEFECKGGTGMRLRACLEFANFVDSCALFDLGFSGPRFTRRRGLILERLGRTLVNECWM